MTEYQERVPILWIRGEAVILDSDLAALYGVKTGRLNEQIKRNHHRFPPDFVFQLTPEEKKGVIAKCDNPAKVLYYRGLPMALTEHGALMASMVLNSPRAMEMSVFVVRAFVGMRKEMSRNEEVLRRLCEIGPRTPAPGPCQSRLRLLGECAYAPALTAPCWCTTRA